MKPLKPFKYQTECLNEINWLGGRVLVALEPGLGKTFLAFLYLLDHQNNCLPAVVVCPASVKLMWQRECHRFTRIRAGVAEGRTPPDSRPEKRRRQVIVINYDILSGWVGWLRELKPRLVILDESQYIANQSKRTKAVQALCRGVPRILALSGTPLLNRPIELFNTLHLLQPKEFPSRWAFGHTYCGPQMTPWGWKYEGASNTKELHSRLLSTVMVRRRKADVLGDLPDKLRSVVPLPLSSPSEYTSAKQDFLNWLHRQDPSRAHRAAKAEAMTKVGYLLRLAAKLKLPAAMEWIEEQLASEEKLVVFLRHTEIMQQLQNRFENKCVTVDGSVTLKGRREAVIQFQRDNRVRLFLGNIQAAGTGLDGLQDVCSRVAFAELAWRPGDHIQAEDRCHRIGTKSTVWCTYLVARGTIEEKLCRVLQEKQQTLSSTLDGEGSIGELSVFDQLMRLVSLVRER